MEKYSPLLIKDPQPLAVIIGSVETEPDIHSRLIYSLRLSLEEIDHEAVLPPITFKSVANDHQFREKKPSKEFPSYDGILKSNWLQKHSEVLPSVVVLLAALSVDWNTTEWNRREGLIQEKYTKMKSALSTRDCKIVVVVVRVGMGALEKDVVDERLSSLKKHTQLDSKSFHFITNNELSVNSSLSIKKISKSIREHALAYYTSQCKRIRNMEKAMTANRSPLDMILVARYNFKLGIFNEFLGQKPTALKFYRTSYDACVSAIDVLDEEWTDQIETLAEYNHFKISNILLLSGSAKEASLQFKSHVSKFLKAYSSPWRHFAWLADQHIVFAQLLDQYKIADSSIDADRSFYYFNAAKNLAKRQNVFEHALEVSNSPRSVGERRQRLLSNDGSMETQSNPLTLQTKGGQDLIQFRGVLLTLPRFVGSHPQVLDPAKDFATLSNEDSASIVKKYYEEQEKAVDQGHLVIVQLRLSLKHLDKAHNRRRIPIEGLMADQYYKVELYRESFNLLQNITTSLISEGWIEAATPYLYQQLECVVRLGDIKAALHTLLILYSKSSSEFLDMYKKEQLHRDIFFILNAASQLSTMTCTENKDALTSASSNQPENFSNDNKPIEAFSTNIVPLSPRSSNEMAFLSYIGITKRHEFGSSATASNPAEYFLPNGYTILLSQSSSSLPVLPSSQGLPNALNSTVCSNVLYNPHLFEISTKFHLSTVSVDQEVNVSVKVKSMAQLSCTFSEMIVYFLGKSIIIRFTHDTTCGVGDSLGGANIQYLDGQQVDGIASYPGQLVFKPKTDAVFTFPIKITESIVQRLLNNQQTIETILCVEKVEFLCIHSLPESMQQLENSVSSHRVILSQQIMPEGIGRSKDSQLSEGSAIGTSSQVNIPRKPWTMQEITTLFGIPRLSLLEISKPSAGISLVNSNEGIVLLQGPLQRVNFIFNSGKDDIINGKLFLSSDYTPLNEDDSLFWYPDSESLENRSNDEKWHDEVVFNPLILNSSFQPAHPLKLPSYSPNTTFAVPVFLRYEMVGQIKVRARIEYLLKQGRKISVSKEFEVKVSFIQPLRVNFNPSSKREAQCGMLREAGIITVLHGDTIAVSSTLTCLDSLSHEIDILAFELHPNTESNLQSSSSSYFKIANQDDSLKEYNLLLPSLTKEHALLRKGESFTNSVDILCVGASNKKMPGILSSPSVQPSNTLEKVKQSIGDVYLYWRLNDSDLFNAVNIQGIPPKNNSETQVIDHHHSKWLPQIDSRGLSLNNAGVEESTVNRNINITRLCSMKFSIPVVQVTSAPFDVQVESPRICNMYDMFDVRVTIKNYLNTYEKVILKVDEGNEAFFISGSSLMAYDVSPQAVFDIKLSVMPVRCGQLHLPHFNITWEKNSASIVDIGGKMSPKHVFVKP